MNPHLHPLSHTNMGIFALAYYLVINSSLLKLNETRVTKCSFILLYVAVVCHVFFCRNIHAPPSSVVAAIDLCVVEQKHSDLTVTPRPVLFPSRHHICQVLPSLSRSVGDVESDGEEYSSPSLHRCRCVSVGRSLEKLQIFCLFLLT